MATDRSLPVALADVQDVEVNYYVLVPFTTAFAAKWAAEQIAETLTFDCHVIGLADVNQAALVVADVRGGDA